jgi:glycolate oxidase iron-sulfur subunit
MQTSLSPEYQGTPDGEEAQAIIRKCVHCGFCNATCPTYQLLGDELDGPRGRIYLIKQVLEGGDITRSTQQHLDRCLTCLNCQTTCPSGVEYGHLVDIGRRIVDAGVQRPAGERAVRWLLKEGLTSRVFAPAMRLGRALRPVLPAVLKAKMPARVPAPAAAPVPMTAPAPPNQNPAFRRKVLLLRGCVQPAMRPSIDAAAVRVLAAAGIEAAYAGGGCCGALRTHLGDQPGGADDVRRNIDAWTPGIAADDVAIVATATACSLAIKGYGHALLGDARYAAAATRISALARDLSDLLPELVPALKGKLRTGFGRLAMHSPCTLQHGQKQMGVIETHLRTLGFDLRGCEESHLCCGSAGTYSVLQPDISLQLRDRKLANLAALKPHYIISANWGCMQQLQSGTDIPVLHWVELLSQALP